jgi:hypothetical protein
VRYLCEQTGMMRLCLNSHHPDARGVQHCNPPRHVTNHANRVWTLPLQGLIPRLMRIPPGQAIVWAVSDQITGHFERRRMEAAVAP